MSGNNLTETIERWSEIIASRLLSVSQFRDVLSEIVSGSAGLLEEIEIRVVPGEPFTEMLFGVACTGEATEVRSVILDKYETHARVSVWRAARRESITPPEVMPALVDLVKAYWKPDVRDKYRMVAQTIAGAAMVEATIDELRRRPAFTAEFFCDLDNFKQVNDKINHETGDRVIAAFGALLTDIVSPDGVVIHRSDGSDEFLILYPADSVTTILSLARRTMLTVEARDFGTGEVRVGATFGIALIGAAEAAAGSAEVERIAEAAMHDDEGKKNRGRARFYVSAAPNYPLQSNPGAIDTAITVTKTGLTLAAPFANPWLNLVSHEVCAASPEANSGQSTVEKTIEWIGPNFDAHALATAFDPAQVVVDDPRFSRLDVAFAVAHGVMRAALDCDASRAVSIEYWPDDSSGRVMSDGKSFYSWGIPKGESRTIDLGYSVTAVDFDSDRLHRASRAILVRIGHRAVTIPEVLFGRPVVVDDRPTLGGGLPDFWEGAIARLVSSAAADPNITDVFVMGDHAAARLTVEQLKDIGNWGSRSSGLSAKTGISTVDISDVAKRLSGRIHFPVDAAALAAQFAKLSRESFKFVARQSPARGRTLRFMNRELAGNGFALGPEDGCRVSTLARAYPLVLEIVRKAVSDERIVDQAGLELRELLDFKVVLTNPLRDILPSFYANDLGSFEEYFQKQFKDRSGLFRSAFEGYDQLERVLQHIEETLAGKSRRFNTRRAVLVVPHIPEQGRDLSPLGLISIRIIPRFLGARIVLTYSFTWRTVEVLVGFPYSLYGSVRFAQDLTETIQRRMPDNLGRFIDMGEVSYVAHSLHFFVDEYGQNIARQIVDEATF